LPSAESSAECPRHSLNAFLARVGGHIGYVVAPEFRRRGHATMMLRLALKIANEKLGIGVSS
jgi:predicted acetyltransferase